MCAQSPGAAPWSGMHLGKGSSQPPFRAVALGACVLSLLLHLHRKYLGYFCRGDITVWLHKHFHGWGK